MPGSETSIIISAKQSACFTFYLILLFASFITFGLWMSTNDPNNAWPEIIFFILLSLLFVYSINLFTLHQSVDPASWWIVGLYLVTMFGSMVRCPFDELNGRVYRNWAIGLGLSSIIPATCLYALKTH